MSLSQRARPIEEARASAPLGVVFGTSPRCDLPPVAPPADRPTRPADREAARGRTAPRRLCSGTPSAARCARAPGPDALSSARTEGRVPARASGGPARAARGGRWESASSPASLHFCGPAAHAAPRQAAAPTGAGSPWSKRLRQRSQQRSLPTLWRPQTHSVSVVSFPQNGHGTGSSPNGAGTSSGAARPHVDAS